MAGKDYSHRALIDKLSIKGGALNDAAPLEKISSRTSDCSVNDRKKNCDVILFGSESIADLRKVESLRELLATTGGLGIIYPKGRKDIAEKHVREAGLAIGLVDNKVVSFSATHTGLRFVIGKPKRL